jgi:hypothetical protein
MSSNGQQANNIFELNDFHIKLEDEFDDNDFENLLGLDNWEQMLDEDCISRLTADFQQNSASPVANTSFSNVHPNTLTASKNANIHNNNNNNNKQSVVVKAPSSSPSTSFKLPITTTIINSSASAKLQNAKNMNQQQQQPPVVLLVSSSASNNSNTNNSGNTSATLTTTPIKPGNKININGEKGKNG